MKTKILDTLNFKYANYLAVKLPLLPVLINVKSWIMSLGSINFQQKSFQTVGNEKLFMSDIIKERNYKMKHFWNICCMHYQECEQFFTQESINSM